jgi:hypothetical protein
MRIPAAAAVAPCHSLTGAEKVNELQGKDLDCRPTGAGKPGPCTRLYLTPTHSHRGSCPASPGEPGSGQLSPEAPPDVPAPGRSQNNAGWPCLASRGGRSCHHGRRLNPAGPRHRRRAREGHAGRCAPRRWVLVDSDEVVASPWPKGRRRAGRASSGQRSTRPCAARTSPPSEFSSGPSFWHRESARDQPVT